MRRDETTHVEPDQAPGRELNPRAWAFLALTAFAALGVAVPFLPQLAHAHAWPTFFVLGGLAAVAQLFPVRTPRDQNYATSVVFVVPAVLLLPPELVALLATVQHVPDWVRTRSRRRWYIQTFNISNWTVAALAAWAASHPILGTGRIADANLRFALAALVAAAVIVAVNHTVLALMLHLARGHSLRETGLLSGDALTTELVLALLGVPLAYVWLHEAYWLVPATVAPLVLIHRSLAVPALQEQVRVDPKTGLFNTRHFMGALEDELARAGRFGRPLSLLMADLDLLRDINNTYGHLAGDAVLTGIADVFREELRHYDVASRFGGEEFAIILPETGPEQAVELAERIRRGLAATQFVVKPGQRPIRATISIGVAGYPRDATDLTELIDRADMAVYQAKLLGRNRVVDASNLGAGEGGARRSARLAAVPDEPERPPESPREQAERLLAEGWRSAIEGLSASVDARDSSAEGHSRRVQRLALAVGRELGLPPTELEVLGQAALFHDVGKLAVPDALLTKSADLSDEEWLAIERHSDEGARLVAKLGFLDEAVPLIRHHHERYDGRGYPEGLAAEEIPVGARIIHACDALDAMTTDRSYKPALTLEEAVGELRRESGKQFCPRCVAAVEQVLGSELPQSA